MPKLLGPFLTNVQLCLTDGDSQETGQLDAAIDACWHCCTFHIITKKWDDNVNKRVSSSLSCNRAQRDEMRKLLQSWQYSWTDERCETREEMDLSISLFLAYLETKAVRDVMTESDINAIIHITRGTVLALRDQISFYVYSSIRHYDARTTSGHEGTNKGLKSGSTVVQANQTLARAAAITVQKDDNHHAQTVARATRELSHNKLWSNSCTANFLNDMGEGLVREQVKKACNTHYSCEAVTTEKFQALFHVAPSGSSEVCHEVDAHNPVPVFRRVCQVSVSEDKMYCSCKYFERFGIPCRHMVVVLWKYSPGHAFTHHDISVIWWKIYPVYAASPDCPTPELSAALIALATKDIAGPRFPGFFATTNARPLETSRLPPELRCQPTTASLLNYPPGFAETASRRYRNQEQIVYEETLFTQDDDDDEGGNLLFDQSVKTLPTQFFTVLYHGLRVWPAVLTMAGSIT